MKNIETTLDVSAAYPLSEIKKLSHALTYLNTMSARINENGEVTFEDSALPKDAQRLGIVPLMTVSCMLPEAAHGICSEPAEAFAEKILEHTEKGGYKGVNFSFLRVFPFEREKYTLFLKKCAEALHGRGYFAGSIVLPPCALSLATANDYMAQGEFLDRVNFLLSDCLYRKDSLKRRLSDGQIIETLDLARENIPPQKLAVTIADHGLAKMGDGEVQTVPCALARSLSVPGAEYDDEKSYAALFEKLASYGVTEIAVRPAGRADNMLFKVLSERFDIIKV